MSSFVEHLDVARIQSVDYDDPAIPDLVRELKPTVYADTPDRDTYCCILGEDPQSGTFGCGNTPLEAMKDWEKNYRKRSGRIKKPTVKRSITKLLKEAVKGKMPTRVKPMLCTLTAEVRNDPSYLYEIKWDGYRIMSYVQQGKVRLDSRGGKDYTAKYPPVTKALKALKVDVVLDGEMVVFDEEGHPSFNGVQLYNGHETPIFYYLFDILWLEGYDLRELPLTKRKGILRELIKGNGALRISESFENGEGLFHLMKEKGFEGIVAKRKDSQYIEDDRSLLWLKIPIKRIDEFVIGGWAESDKVRSFRSILFGAYDDGQLKWVGRSGGGFKERDMPGILKKLQLREIKVSPFINPVLDTKGAVIHWVKPQLVGIFEYSEMTETGRIRKPATWKGFRTDKAAKQVVLPVVKEMPAAMKKGKSLKKYP